MVAFDGSLYEAGVSDVRGAGAKVGTVVVSKYKKKWDIRYAYSIMIALIQ